MMQKREVFAVALREITMLSVPIRIIAAIVISGIIGMERGLKNRAAGFRTYILVCVGSCIIMMINQFVFQELGTGDPTRMAAQVVSGIGFLGAGSIIVTSHNQIKGLTTAAGLWASACLGLAVGFGLYEIALVGGITIFLVLTMLHHWENRLRRNAKVLTVYLELNPDVSLSDFIKEARQLELTLSNIQIEPEDSAIRERVCLLATVKGKNRMKRSVMLNKILESNSVQYLEEL